MKILGTSAIAVVVLFGSVQPFSFNFSKKRTIDLLITHGTVLTMNNKKQIIQDGAVALHKDVIIDVGTTAQLEKNYQAKQVINADNNAVLPGLINGHTHAAMTLFRGLADDLTLQGWLTKYILPAEKKNVNYDFVYWGSKLGCLEMIGGGTTTFVDMYYFEDAVAKAATEMGMRCIAGQTIMDSPTPDSATPQAALNYTKNFIKKWRKNNLVIPAVAPHAPYSCCAKTLLAAKKLASYYKVPLLTHLSETQPEVEASIKEHGKRPVQYLNSIGFLGNNLVAAHVVHVDNTEIALLRRYAVGVIHNPQSNMKLSSGIAPIANMLGQGLLVGIGTDSATSNNALDMFAEIKTTSLLQKVATGNPTALDAYQALELATIGCARALHLDKKIGSLERGKKADLIIVNLTQAHSKPMYNIASQLVYSTKSSDVSTVVINGAIVLNNKQFLNTEEQKTILAKTGQLKKQIALRLNS